METTQKTVFLFNFPAQGYNFQVFAETKAAALVELKAKLDSIGSEIQREMNQSKAASAN